MRPSIILASLVLALAAGCAPSPGPAFYLLEPAARPTGVVSGPVVGLREIALPLYARRAQIAVLGPGGEITLSDDHRWAEEPPRAASRQIARDLSARLNRPVVVEPWPEGAAPETRVDVEVDVFVGALGGEVRLAGQYRLVDPARPEAAALHWFELSEPVADDTFGALVAAHRRALSALAATIAADLGG